MRLSGALMALFVIGVGAPFVFVYAAEPQCLKSGQTVTLTSKDAVKGQAERQVSCADLCSDEEITLTQRVLSSTLSIQTTRECRTEADKEKYGCAKGQIPPRVVIILKNSSDSKKITVSKCDKNKLNQAFRASIDSESVSSLEALAREQAPSLAQVIAEGPSTRGLFNALTLPADPSTDAGRQQLAEQLRTMGVANANEVIASNPNRASDMLRAMAEGNKTGAESIARELKLNDEVISNVGRISDEIKQDSTVAASGDPNTPYVGVPSATGFNQNAPASITQSELSDMDRAKYAICFPESGCNYYKLGSITRTGDRAYGKYQVMGVNVRQWTCEVGQCMTPQQFVDSPEMQERVFEHQFGEYMAQYGPSGAARAWFAGPGCVYKRCPGDQLGTGVNGYEARFSALFKGTVSPSGSYNKYVQSPIPDTSNGYTYTSPPVPQSPFAIGNPYGSSNASPQQPQYAPPQSRSVGPILWSVPGVVPKSGDIALPATPQQFKPILLIITQSEELDKGDPILVSWTSVGTAFPNVTCEVGHKKPDEGIARISESKESSNKVIQTSDLAPGEHTFVFRCKVAGGEMVTKETSVIVR
ncbi:hypothetical protein A2673_00765 [Candidatus Kaiserbacteria bacterium RIFCSPHIGHO2_01_FULL_50_13]|uniref:Uncharacterized protein n=1 Tax=Candidatus Kaiserbacteria bacterium RIFCSPLOWO2_01_FULL_50_24 TaxID=1798507 RepID=A0A1F6EMW6_9BACT|nr:MAG: hypothetical protein A2673_00765 [Candidatus Kaiserbacteria bacterium RIFCSPHIGHO2_01_FULL_50_13]OGG74988.1 MAG: hypothetical protein A3A34_04200 [Candidatus Kaiserbacteria bacterium RIFCSPLOWO2_01_FULL_50_24]OGG81791.1 MAG: hypothetical protein A3H74_01275 [Candidatus Kaiserbacteria bacterium RIFCSPLOWO2_02_FULL_51_13]